MNYATYPGRDNYLGHGRINALKALAYTNAYTNGRVVPDNYSSIQSAIDAATSGQTVFVKPGTYYEKISMKDGVNVVGAGYWNTTIDATSFSDYAVKFSNLTSNGAKITGINIKRTASNYGAVQIQNSKAEIRDCKI